MQATRLTAYRPTNFLSQFLTSQFVKLPYPEGDFTGQTVIVTGANVGYVFHPNLLPFLTSFMS
jgi:hypothetical protein